MTMEIVAVLLVLMGAASAGLVHNPNTMLIGLCFMLAGLSIMWLSGYNKGRKRNA